MEEFVVFQKYISGEISEETARVVLGDTLDTMEADRQSTAAAIADDLSDLVV